MPKTQLLDKLPASQGFFISIGYFVLLIIFLLVGAGGPASTDFSTPTPLAGTNLVCSDPSACTVTYRGMVKGITGYNQALWLSVAPVRPTDNSTGRVALSTVPLVFDQVVIMDLYGYRNGARMQISNNVTRVGRIYCGPGAIQCSSMMLFTNAYETYEAYEINADFVAPFRPYLEAGIPPSSLAGSTAPLVLQTGFIRPEYTSFQLGTKYFFFAVTVLLYGVWCFQLQFGVGTRDPRGLKSYSTDGYPSGVGKLIAMCCGCRYHPGRLTPTGLQNWTWWLGLLLLFFNEPLFPISLNAPNFSYAAFYAVCVVTFVVTLMMFWLVQFDRARNVDGELDVDGMSLSERLGKSLGLGEMIGSSLCFWLPKTLLLGALWCFGVGAWVWSRYQQIQDPTYSLLTAEPESIKWVGGFAVFLLVIWLLWLIGLLFAGFGPRACKLMTPANRFVVSVTVTTILIVLITFFAQGFTTALWSSSMLMSVYGAVNLFVWYLMIITMPVLPPSEKDLAELYSVKVAKRVAEAARSAPKVTVEMAVQADGGPEDGAYYGQPRQFGGAEALPAAAAAGAFGAEAVVSFNSDVAEFNNDGPAQHSSSADDAFGSAGGAMFTGTFDSSASAAAGGAAAAGAAHTLDGGDIHMEFQAGHAAAASHQSAAAVAGFGDDAAADVFGNEMVVHGDAAAHESAVPGAAMEFPASGDALEFPAPGAAAGAAAQGGDDGLQEWR